MKAFFRRLGQYAATGGMAILLTLEAGSHALPPKNTDARQVLYGLYDQLPFRFESNMGQVEAAEVKFLARGPGYTVSLAPDRIRLAAGESEVSLKLTGASPLVRLEAIGEHRGKTHYLRGGDPSAWRTNIPSFERVAYREAWPGVDVVVGATGRDLELEFTIGPGARPEAIHFEVDGAGKLQRTDGDTAVFTPASGEFRLQSFRASPNNQIALHAAGFQPGRTSLVKSRLTYQSHTAGADCDGCAGIAMDSKGDMYVTGAIRAHNRLDAFVARFSEQGSQLEYVCYLGGSGDDVPYGIAVDRDGRASITGRTSSRDFPSVGPPLLPSGTQEDAFVVTLSRDGGEFLFASRFGGAGDDRGRGIAVDARGDIHVAGGTRSPDFPTRNAWQPVYGGGETDAFVVKIAAGGSGVLFSTFLGGTNGDFGWAIASGDDGSSYITGSSFSVDFPLVNPLFSQIGAGLCGPFPCHDAIAVRLASDGSAPIYSTYIGGSRNDYGNAVAVDREGHAYYTGNTHSLDFPLVHPAQDAMGGGLNDGFVTQIEASGSKLIYSSYLGGADRDWGHGIAVSRDGASVYVTGTTFSDDFPVQKPNQPVYSGGRCGFGRCPDAFLALLHPDSGTISRSTFIGGLDADSGYNLAVDPRSGTAFVLINTLTLRYPSGNPLQQVHAGSPFHLLLARVPTHVR